MSFDYVYSLAGGTGPILKDFPATPSVQYAVGDACKFTNGQIAQAVATDLITTIVNAMITPVGELRPSTPLDSTDTNGDTMQVIMVDPANHVFSSSMTGNYAPVINDAAMNVADTKAGNTTTAVLFTHAEVTGDSGGTALGGGTIYNNNTGETRRINSASYAGGQYTFNLDVATSRVWNGDTDKDSLTVVPWAAGSKAIRLGATVPQQGVSNTIAGQSGGHVNIISVDMAKLLVYVTFAAA